MINTKILDELLSNTGDMCLKRRAKAIITSLSPKKNEIVLDAGCGDGFYLHLLSKFTNAHLIGLDDNPKALDLAKNYVKSKRLKLVEGSVMKMPFNNNKFDKIICSEVLEHLPDDVGGLREFKRVLKKGGELAIVEWKPYIELGPRKENRLSEEELKQLVAPEGFAELKSINAGSHHYGLVFIKN